MTAKRYPWLPIVLAAATAAAAQRKPAAPKQVAIVQPAIHQFEDGPVVGSRQFFVPGDTVFVSFQVSGYQVSEKNRILLSHRVDVFDPAGIRLVESFAGKNDAELAPEDKDWMPKVRHQFLIPVFVTSGNYKILAEVKDELGGSAARHEITLAVRGYTVEPSGKLVVRNFRFLRSEQDAAPLAVAAYRPGDTLWARFEITGYQLGEKNRYHVEYGLSVQRGSGEELYAEPNAADERDESFYPKRFLPGLLSLSLQKEIAPGEYAIVVRVRDQLGNQSHDTRQTFQIE